jgi:GNAT superfamily N-acetyltransferase
MSSDSCLTKKILTLELQDTVQDFSCAPEGQEETTWEQDVSDFIKSELPFYFMAGHGTKVWLYYTSDDQQVGYGSVGPTRWPDGELPKGKRRWINLIPYVSLRGKFRGKPAGPRDQHYSTLIMRDLENEARMVTEYKGDTVFPFLGLFVDPRNLNAIRFYEWYGFRNFPHSSDGIEPGIRNQAMIIKLT